MNLKPSALKNELNAALHFIKFVKKSRNLAVTDPQFNAIHWKTPCAGSMNRWVTSSKPVQGHGPFEKKRHDVLVDMVEQLLRKMGTRFNKNLISQHRSSQPCTLLNTGL